MSIMLLSGFEDTLGKVHAMGEFLQAKHQLEFTINSLVS